jgi:threonine aldolase
MAVDHAHARQAGEPFRQLPGVSVVAPQTNIIFVDLAPGRDGAAVVQAAAERGVRFTGLYRLRLVTHLDIASDDIPRAISVLRAVLQ